MSAFKKWVSKNSDGTFVFLPGDHYAFTQGDAPESNPIHKHLKAIEAAITDVDPNKLKSLLGYSLQCSAVLATTYESDGLGIDEDQDDDAYKTTSYEVSARPFIEGLLFLNNFRELQDIVTAILKAENVQLYQAFKESLPTDTISEDRLFGWSNGLSQKVRDQLHELTSYGQSLCIGGIDKGRTAMDLGIELTNNVNRLEGKKLIQPIPHASPTEAYISFHTSSLYRGDVSVSLTSINTSTTTPGGETTTATMDQPLTPLDLNPSFKKDLRVLQFKLDFCQKLHKFDNVLNEHRHASKLIANLLSILLTGTVANVVNYMLTGNFLFFNKTKSAAMVNEIDDEVRPHTLVMAY